MSRPLTKIQLKGIKDKGTLQKVICYREPMYFDSTKSAMDFFMEGMLSVDPGSSECGRYVKIYSELASGVEVPSDE